ncbi:MAG TPA: hypothetical protein VFX65_09920, partial [Candidatus Limnocylindrales bacterium]|nr:hypothetical protein [Candidatus Limnocylindrales bacterium]
THYRCPVRATTMQMTPHPSGRCIRPGDRPLIGLARCTRRGFGGLLDDRIPALETRLSER